MEQVMGTCKSSEVDELLRLLATIIKRMLNEETLVKSSPSKQRTS